MISPSSLNPGLDELPLSLVVPPPWEYALFCFTLPNCKISHWIIPKLYYSSDQKSLTSFQFLFFFFPHQVQFIGLCSSPDPKRPHSFPKHLYQHLLFQVWKISSCLWLGPFSVSFSPCIKMLHILISTLPLHRLLSFPRLLILLLVSKIRIIYYTLTAYSAQWAWCVLQRTDFISNLIWSWLFQLMCSIKKVIQLPKVSDFSYV